MDNSLNVAESSCRLSIFCSKGDNAYNIKSRVGADPLAIPLEAHFGTVRCGFGIHHRDARQPFAFGR